MDHYRARTAARLQQRQAAIHFIAVRTPTEAARALLSDPRVTDQGHIYALRQIVGRMGCITPASRELMIRVATPLMPIEARP